MIRLNRIYLYALGTILVLPGCSSDAKVEQVPVFREGQQSPFAEKKVIFSPSFQRKMNGLEQTITAGTKIAVVINLAKLEDRRNPNNPNNKRHLNFFIDSYLPSSFGNQGLQLVKDYALTITLSKDIPLESLEKAVQFDPALVGVSDAPEFEAQITAYNDPYFSSQADLVRLEFEAADNIFQNEIPDNVKVNVAVIDTGYDFSNQDKNLINPLLEGLNIANPSNPNNPQDTNGHGTAMANIIGAVGNNSFGTVGIAHRNVMLTPIRLLADASSNVSSPAIFNSFTRAVNAGAEVVTVPFELFNRDPEGVCNPIVGHAIYLLAQKNVFMSFSGGRKAKLDAQNQPIPGEIFAPKDNGPTRFGTNQAIACWGRYFYGAISSVPFDSVSNVIPFYENYGKDAIEIATHAYGAKSTGLNNQIGNYSGPSVSAAHVAASAALTIAFHRAKGWEYSPALIEAIIKNGSPSNSALNNPSSPRGVRLGKTLNILALANYLVGLKSRTAEQRRREPMDNPELGSGWNLGNISQGNLTNIQIYTKTPFIKKSGFAQFQAVAYYDNAAIQVISDQVEWLSSSQDIYINQQGVVYPSAAAQGAYTITARYNNFESSRSIFVTELNPYNGLLSDLASLQIIPTSTQYVCCARSQQVDFAVQAIYSDGRRREVTNSSSFSVSHPEEIGDFQTTYALPNKDYKIFAMYEGKQAVLDFRIPARTASNLAIKLFGQGNAPKVTFTAGEQITPAVYFNMAGLSSQYVAPQSNINYLSSHPQIQAMLSSPSKEIDTTNLAPGNYSISAVFNYFGNGTSQNLNVGSITFEILPAQLLSIQLNATGLPYHGKNAGGFSVTGIYSGGFSKTIPSSELEWTVQDSMGTSLLNTTDPEVFVSFGELGVGLQIFKGNPGFTYTGRARHIATGLQTQSITKSTIGIVEYQGNPVSGYFQNFTPAAIPAPANSSYCTATLQQQSPFAGGTGTLSDPYQICSASQLMRVSSYYVPSGSSPDLHFKLMTNIDLASIVDLIDRPIKVRGSFDGNGFEIKNAVMVDAERQLVGLFGAGNRYEIKNLGLRDPQVRGYRSVGAFTGALNLQAKISNSYVTGGFVWCWQECGAVVGGSNGVISGVFNYDTQVFGDWSQAGGLVGKMNNGRIERSWASTDIQFGGISATSGKFGGLAGEVFASCTTHSPIEQATCGVIVDSFAEGTLRSGSGANVGGLVGQLYQGALIRTWSDVEVISNGSKVGGLVGRVDGVSGFTYGGLIFASHSVGKVWGGASSIGGLVGSAELALIQDSWTESEVLGVSTAGGLVGLSDEYNRYIRSEAASKIQSNNDPVGLFIGKKTPFFGRNINDRFINNVAERVSGSQPEAAVGLYLNLPNHNPTGIQLQ